MKKLSQVEPSESTEGESTQMMAKFCKGYAPLRDGMMSNRQHWTDVAKEKGLSLEAPANNKGQKADDYGNLWEKYWNMDPDNFIWGIDPNEAPPEVVIERVVFSPKKKAGKTLSALEQHSNGDSTSSAKGDKGKKNARKSQRNSESADPSAHSDSGSNSKNSKMCRVM